MPLTIINKQQIFEGKFMKVWGTTFLDKEGGEHVWEWAEKKDIIMILAITNDNKAVLIKIFRVPLGRYTIELPAGLLDKDGESTEEAVRRELLEETGYEIEKIYSLPVTAYAAGAINNLVHPFIGTGAKKVVDNHGDATEEISVIEVPVDELAEYYLNNTDSLFNIKILALYQVALSKGLIK